MHTEIFNDLPALKFQCKWRKTNEIFSQLAETTHHSWNNTFFIVIQKSWNSVGQQRRISGSTLSQVIERRQIPFLLHTQKQLFVVVINKNLAIEDSLKNSLYSNFFTFNFQSELKKLCEHAYVCFHDTVIICGKSVNEARTFLDLCDLYEYSCEYNMGTLLL